MLYFIVEEINVLHTKQIDDSVSQLGEIRKVICVKTPDTVEQVPRLKYDPFAIKSLMNNKKPVRRFFRGENILVSKYRFGDTSGTVLGSIWTTLQSKVKYRFGVWGSDEEKGSYNLKELRNLFGTVEQINNEDDGLSGVERSIFTYNSVAEGAFFRDFHPQINYSISCCI